METQEMDDIQRTQKLQKMLDDQTRLILARIDKTDATLKPIAEIYESIRGTGSVLKFILNTIIIPLSIIIGIYFTIKKSIH